MNAAFYALTNDLRAFELPEAQYAAAALRQYHINCDQKGEAPVDNSVVLDVHQYRVIHSAVMAELEDADGDDLIPTYLVITKENLQAVFPHPSVDTPEEVAQFIETYPLAITGPILLTDVRDHWPMID